MDVLGWIGWLALKVLAIAWSILWFLLGGWVSTLAQIGVIALLIFGYKYGWRQAPQEIMSRGSRLTRAVWGWARAREPRPVTALSAPCTHQARRAARAPGDVNLSTLLNILMLAGLAVAALV